jgi:pyruvate,water dikinase
MSANHAIKKPIAELLDAVTAETVRETSRRIHDIILNQALTGQEVQTIVRAYELVGAQSVAVRSSGLEEDGGRFSFAGQFSSFLNVSNTADLIDAVKRCWASAYSRECLSYRLSHDLPLHPAGIAVVIQEMIACEKSGVIFTANPVSGHFDEMLLSSVYGLGEGLVSGAVDADTFLVGHANGVATSTQLGEKLQKIRPITGASFCEAVDVGADERNSASLSEEEIHDIWRLARQIEELQCCPQDIEWGIANGRINVLQTRDITSLAGQPVPRGELRVWDNSNIIESFGGITAPMTFSFANEAYYQVFLEYCRLLGVPSKALGIMSDWLSAMLGHHRGRVYYNLLNWYRVVRLVPFYAINKKALELGIGTRTALDDDTAYSLRPWPTQVKSDEIALRIICGVCFFYHFLTIDRRVNRFVRDFEVYEKRLEALEFSSIDAGDIHKVLRQTMKDLLPRWGGMILLEQTISLTFGALSTLFQRWAPEAPRSAIFRFARAGASVESVEPINEMKACARLVLRDAALARFISEAPASEIYQTLLKSKDEAFVAFAAAVRSYIARYGYRCANELKLEEPDMADDPARFFTMLRGFLRQGEPDETGNTKESPVDDYHGVGGWRRLALKLLVGKVRRSLNARERVRFCRTRAFGITRRMIRAIGQHLHRSDVLSDVSDVFYLRITELKGWFDSAIPLIELRETIAVRKAQQVKYATLEGPERFITRGAVYEDDYQLYGWEQAQDGLPLGETPAELSGTPCSAGVAEGEIEVTDVPHDMAGKIMVTYRTDPGWCTILPSASALVIERGSPLTHVAIVARELGIPTVVQVPHVTKRVQNGMRLRVDGSSGRIRVLT